MRMISLTPVQFNNQPERTEIMKGHGLRILMAAKKKNESGFRAPFKYGSLVNVHHYHISASNEQYFLMAVVKHLQAQMAKGCLLWQHLRVHHRNIQT